MGQDYIYLIPDVSHHINDENKKKRMPDPGKAVIAPKKPRHARTSFPIR